MEKKKKKGHPLKELEVKWLTKRGTKLTMGG